MRWLTMLALLAASGCGSRGAASGGDGDARFRIATVVTGLGATTDLAFLPDGRMIVTEKSGAVKIAAVKIAEGGQAREIGAFQVDTESEKGLLGVVVDPAFDATRRLFFYYSLADAFGGTDEDRNRAVSIRLGADDRLDADSEEVILRGLRGPANHDGGALAIGPDGFLYVGVGDSGAGDSGACGSGRPPEPPLPPTNFFATCLTNANGKILRIALDGTIPADNPLVGVEASACGSSCGAPPAGVGAARPEIWAWGLRNPWRFAFDPATDLLWVGDVGEISYEELTIVEKGRHHGWPWREGRHGWPVSKCNETIPGTGDCVEPVYECGRVAAPGVDGDCRSITGGVFLSADQWPADLRGSYVFGDNVNGRIWAIELAADRRSVVPGSRRELTTARGAPVSFRVGPEGDVYVAVLPGEILRISPAGAP